LKRRLAGNAGLNPSFEAALLARIEDAGLNASAPPQQLWQDGWLLRLSPGKAKRARCINAVARGRLPLAPKLARAQSLYAVAGLPMVVRITPFTQPAMLDVELAARGFEPLDDTRVMVLAQLAEAAPAAALPRGLRFVTLSHSAMAQAVGALRGSPLSQQQAHAERMAYSPVPFAALAIQRVSDNSVLACGQMAREDDLVGLYDVFVAERARGRGLATRLCARLLADAHGDGARSAYLQVEGDNAAARAVYARLGFADGYGYHYRIKPAA
jgi:ribosomal protein S18 acetylase RimI-like enzyme